MLDGTEELEVHIIGADWKEGRSKEQGMGRVSDLLVHRTVRVSEKCSHNIGRSTY